ncbi:hypothetical protein UFOVP255_15 [uncultured Caudovirales phage]|uniref:Uncharacterized protein n=1 Tax=uncultured Caudovirales phage TaxID=2100421 RepID=A0A6J5LH14_9CAUD|nr:hypothetical protein UFOVP255_15 [uncultured Caudovirales phage]
MISYIRQEISKLQEEQMSLQSQITSGQNISPQQSYRYREVTIKIERISKQLNALMYPSSTSTPLTGRIFK